LGKTVFVIFGNAGAGKDTLSEKLCELLPNSKHFAFADPLKCAARHLLGLPQHILYGNKEQKESYTVYDRTAREWLQWIGTEMGRESIHKDVWVHRSADYVKDNDYDWFVISDGRFDNERVEFKKYLGNQVRVVNILIVRTAVEVNPSHPSESEVFHMRKRHEAGEKLFDVAVRNDGSIDDLGAKAQVLIRRFTEGE